MHWYQFVATIEALVLLSWLQDKATLRLTQALFSK
jgi:hypothetical protein